MEFAICIVFFYNESRLFKGQVVKMKNDDIFLIGES